jgi:serine/threonine protein kinase
VSPQTDVYSLGVMAFELFLEQLPFEAETSAEIMAMHLRAVPPRPSEAWPDIPPTLENLLLAMLEKDPDARPSMLTVAHTLEQVRSELVRRRDEVAESTEPADASQSRIAAKRASSHGLAAPLESYPGLAPTEPASSAEWRRPNTRWHVAVGAFALAASTAMFLLSRDPERAAAAAAKPTAADTLPAETQPAEATDPATPKPDLKPDVAIAQSEETAAVPTTATPPTPPTPTAAPAKPHHHKVYKLSAKPRRDASHDPDGTVDPYQ